MRSLVLVVGLLMCAVGDLSAVVRTVINTADSGPGSLRYQVNLANDGDTIEFDTGLLFDTIQLTASAHIFIKKDIFILGPGPTQLTVNAMGTGRVFLVSQGNKVHIQGLNLINGGQSLGGAIWNKGQLNLVNVHIKNCFAGTFGGAIASGEDSLFLKNCYLYNNSAESFGGAIYVDSGSYVSLELVSLDSNITRRSGGGLYGRADFFDFNSVIFRDNRAENSEFEFPAEGGGFEIDGDLRMVNSVVVTNYARDAGGGVTLDGGAHELVNSLIIRNFTEDRYAGIHIRVNDPASASLPTSFYNCRIEYNLCDNEGAGIGFDPGYAAKHCTIDSSLVRFNYALNENGGGIFHSGLGTMDVIKTDIAFNRCGKSGSGIYTTPIAGLHRVIASTIHGNIADSDGGGIYHRSPIEIIRSTISENSAFFNAGAILSSSNLDMFHCTVADNIAILGDAALYKQSGGSDISGCIFDQNIALLGLAEIRMDVPIISNGNNIVNSDSLDLWLGLPSDILGVPSLIGTLEDNGGATLTHSLTRYSPARDAGDSTIVGHLDQREEEPWNDIPDIGAFEYNFCDMPVNRSVSFPDSAQVLLSWEPVKGTEVYAIEGGPVPGFFFLTVYASTPSKLAIGFPPNSSYHWRVRALCNINSISDFSPLDTFTTPDYRQMPELPAQQASTSMSVYPNPTTGDVYIELPPMETGQETALLRVLDLNGREVYRQRFGLNEDWPTVKAIKLPASLSGAYWLNVHSGSYTDTRPIHITR